MTPYMINRGKDEDGRQEPPSTSCCAAGVVHYNLDAERFVDVTWWNSDMEYAMLEEGYKCKQCSKAVTGAWAFQGD